MRNHQKTAEGKFELMPHDDVTLSHVDVETNVQEELQEHFQLSSLHSQFQLYEKHLAVYENKSVLRVISQNLFLKFFWYEYRENPMREINQDDITLLKIFCKQCEDETYLSALSESEKMQLRDAIEALEKPYLSAQKNRRYLKYFSNAKFDALSRIVPADFYDFGESLGKHLLFLFCAMGFLFNMVKFCIALSRANGFPDNAVTAQIHYFSKDPLRKDFYIIECVNAIKNAMVSPTRNFTAAMYELGFSNQTIHQIIGICASWITNCTMPPAFSEQCTRINEQVLIGCDYNQKNIDLYRKTWGGNTSLHFVMMFLSIPILAVSVGVVRELVKCVLNEKVILFLCHFLNNFFKHGAALRLTKNEDVLPENTVKNMMTFHQDFFKDAKARLEVNQAVAFSVNGGF